MSKKIAPKFSSDFYILALTLGVSHTNLLMYICTPFLLPHPTPLSHMCLAMSLWGMEQKFV